MGVGSAFNTALGGLSAYGNQVGYISDNLANVSTPGYKRVDADFQSYVTLATPTVMNPGGVNIAPAYRNTLAGQVSSSANPTAFAVSEGNGFAPVTVPTSVTGGVANFGNSLPLYTRACDFSVDTNGYLVNSAGDYLEGVKEQTTYAGDVPGTPSLGNLVGVRVDPTVYKSIPGTASSTVDYNANFPAGMTAVPVGDPNAAASQVTSQVQFFDSLGNSQTLQLTYQKVPVAATAPQSPTNLTPGTALADTTSQWQLVQAIVPGIPTAAGSYLDVLAGITKLATGTDTAGNPVSAADQAAAAAFVPPNDSLYFTAQGALNGDAALNIGPLLKLPIDWSQATTPTGVGSPQALSLNYGSIATTTAPGTARASERDGVLS